MAGKMTLRVQRFLRKHLNNDERKVILKGDFVWIKSHFNEMSFPFKTISAYVLCYKQLNSWDTTFTIHRLEQKGIKIADLHLASYFTQKHFEEWKKKYGGDWRGLLQYEATK